MKMKTAAADNNNNNPIIIINEQKTKSNKTEKNINRSFGLIAVGILGALATGIVAIASPFVWPAFRKVVLPYVPATKTQTSNVLQALKYKRPHLNSRQQQQVNHNNNNSNQHVIDLGSGDGRIVNI